MTRTSAAMHELDALAS